MPDLEKTVDFSISDCFVPFKPLRHFPKILKYKNNNSMMAWDFFLATLFTGIQVELSRSLIQSFYILYILTY